MEFTHQRTVTLVAILLIVAALNQSAYTALYIAKVDVPRQLLWGGEGLLFSLLAAFAGSAMVRSKGLTLAFSAIAFSAALNVVQVGVGLTMFGPFGEAAGKVEGLAPAAGAVVAYSFFVYNAAKLMLGLAALVAGLSAVARGGRLLGGVTALVGAVAMIANTLSMAMGRDVLGAIPLAGGSGVLATLLLALCLLGAAKDD
ncbi:thiamine biosynthesis protein ThiC [Erythrobacter donghaensis]|uniref:thiamine biosynthesis protein ThiC n=1 Tax=Erythrobacter donghaensis TaxID=267135 RepID=UPI000A38A72E|nr:thiamine biosynthesis protein ThiC [Erythrobacter donghaensis]